MCVYIYTHKYIYIYTCAHTHTHLHVYYIYIICIPIPHHILAHSGCFLYPQYPFLKDHEIPPVAPGQEDEEVTDLTLGERLIRAMAKRCDGRIMMAYSRAMLLKQK